MTETYDWNPMPHIVDVLCPSCGYSSKFEFAVIVRIEERKDIPFFQSHKSFEYRVFRDSCGHNWHAAIFFPGLHGGNTKSITRVPEGYDPERWEHSKYLSRPNTYLGSVLCSKCGFREEHNLSWPDDAYFSIDYKGHKLWAFHRESAIALRDYIQSSERKFRNHRWSSFLLHIPQIFKEKKSRDSVTKSLNALLSK